MRSVFVFLTIFTLTMVFGIPLWIYSICGGRVRPGSSWERLAPLWARALLRAGGATVEVRNAHFIAKNDVRVYVANHVSWFDIFAIAAVLPRYTFVAKKELRRVPVFGRAAEQIALVYIDRQNRKSSFEAYKAVAGQLRHGASVIVCPEGTRGMNYELRPFKKGPFVLAIGGQVPVVPVVIRGTLEIMRKGSARVRPGHIVLTFLEPISTVGMTYGDRDGLAGRAWHAMADELERQGVYSRHRPVESPVVENA
jgi:1-acyl-sn-glycerol-3-phosphate acyltransferase